MIMVRLIIVVRIATEMCRIAFNEVMLYSPMNDLRENWQPLIRLHQDYVTNFTSVTIKVTNVVKNECDTTV